MTNADQHSTSLDPTSEHWIRRASRLLLDRRPWFRVFEDTVELPSGRVLTDFLRIENRQHAQIFALTDASEVLFVRQFKYGVGRVVLQLPAGYLDEGETPADAARRELLEETGHTASSWEALGGLCADGNRGFGIGHYFLARHATLARAPDPGDDEHLTVVTVPLAEVPALLASGAFAEMGPVAGIALALTRLGALKDSTARGAATDTISSWPSLGSAL